MFAERVNNRQEQRTVYKIITPAIAKDLLSNNKSNRSISKGDVSRYARDMISGNWVTTHQGLLIGMGGALIDGQHRLLAVVSSGVSIKIPVTYDDSIETPLDLPLDTGRKRGATSSLNISTSLAAVSNLAIRYSVGMVGPTLSELKKFVDIIEPYHGLLSKTTRRGIAGGVKLAAIVQMMRGNDVDYCIDTFDRFVGDYSCLDPYPASLFKQLVVDRINMDTNEIFGRAIRVFDSKNRFKSKMLVANRDLVVSEAMEMCKSVFLPLIK